MSETGPGQDVLASFSGEVRCTVAPEAGSFSLSGPTPEGEPLTLTFSGRPPKGLPASLGSPCVERMAEAAYLIRDGHRQWPLVARSVHLHRELPSFYRAIQPQVPPWHRRLFWRLLLGLAGRRSGFALLRRLRGDR